MTESISGIFLLIVAKIASKASWNDQEAQGHHHLETQVDHKQYRIYKWKFHKISRDQFIIKETWRIQLQEQEELGRLLHFQSLWKRIQRLIVHKGISVVDNHFKNKAQINRRSRLINSWKWERMEKSKIKMIIKVTHLNKIEDQVYINGQAPLSWNGNFSMSHHRSTALLMEIHPYNIKTPRT